MKTHVLVVAVLVVLVVSLFGFGCKQITVQTDMERIISAANIIISAGQNYRDWGSDLTALVQVLELAGVNVPTRDRELAAYLIAVAKAVKDIANGHPPIATAAITPLGADAASPGRPLPRTKDDANRWVRVVTTPDQSGRTALDILSKHVEDKSLLEAFHVEPR